MHADRHTSRGVYTMFWTLTKYVKFISYYFNIFNLLFLLYT